MRDEDIAPKDQSIEDRYGITDPEQWWAKFNAHPEPFDLNDPIVYDKIAEGYLRLDSDGENDVPPPPLAMLRESATLMRIYTLQGGSRKIEDMAPFVIWVEKCMNGSINPDRVEVPSEDMRAEATRAEATRAEAARAEAVRAAPESSTKEDEGAATEDSTQEYDGAATEDITKADEASGQESASKQKRPRYATEPGERPNWWRGTSSYTCEELLDYHMKRRDVVLPGENPNWKGGPSYTIDEIIEYYRDPKRQGDPE